jgi:hypothetical protein
MLESSPESNRPFGIQSLAELVETARARGAPCSSAASEQTRSHASCHDSNAPKARSGPGLAAHAAERWAAFPALAAEWALRTKNEAALEHTRAQLAASGPAS